MSQSPATLVFDGDQTLWDFRSAMVRALGETRIEIARVTGAPLAEVPSIETLIAIREEVGAAADPSDTVTCLRRAAFADAFDHMGQPPRPDLVDRVTEFFFGRRYEMCRPYLETVPTLQSLRETYRIALLTNVNAHADKIGLTNLFDVIVVAEEIATRKPDPTVYALVADRCGGGRFVSIGDSVDDDIVGAQRAGWKTVWVNREAATLPADVRPDAELTTLAGIDVALARVLS